MNKQRLALKHSQQFVSIANNSAGSIAKERFMAKARLVLKHYLRKQFITFPETERYNLNYLTLKVESVQDRSI